jgi:triphosphoribosyl-dephospho-CoA synthase
LPERSPTTRWRRRVGAEAGPARARDDGDEARRTIALAATLACVLEASAPKVGNVTPWQAFSDTRFDDFVSGAVAFGPAAAVATPGRVGRAVWEAVQATRRVVSTNTNLGMALLFAPIAAAWPWRGRRALRQRLREVLATLTIEDARWAYRAIRLAAPGGLGRSPRADVARPPAVTLRAAMALASRRDSIAGEYARDFPLTCTVALPALRRALRSGLGVLDAIAHAHLELLARVPDTLIARKAGAAAAMRVSARARAVTRAGGMRTRRGRLAAHRFDQFLRREGNRLNPGTSADLIAGALFVLILDGGLGRLHLEVGRGPRRPPPMPPPEELRRQSRRSNGGYSDRLLGTGRRPRTPSPASGQDRWRRPPGAIRGPRAPDGTRPHRPNSGPALPYQEGGFGAGADARRRR